MALRFQSSYGGGELDPALHERTTLKKYDSGLASGRGGMIGKTGRIISRMGRKLFVATKLTAREVRLYSPQGSGYLIEWGHQYVRSYSIDAVLTGQPVGTLIREDAHTLTESDLVNLHFESSKDYLYIFCTGKVPLKYSPVSGPISNAFVPVDASNNAIVAPTAATTPIVTSGSGYDVDYAITKVQNGQESTPIYYLRTGAGVYTQKLPISAAESVQVDVNTGLTSNGTTEIRVYRRPKNGGAFGYIGSSSASTTVGANYEFRFFDYGVDADYTHTPPNNITAPGLNPFFPATGAVYQQRLLVANFANVDANHNPEAIHASRSQYQSNFYRDYPISDDSSLAFKSGTSGHARVRRMIGNEGLVVFTSVGVFRHSGALTADNLSLDFKGGWVIDEAVPPLNVPDGVLFVDQKTNSVRILQNTEAGTYQAPELSVFSDHLFIGRSITSWAFHDGETPVLFVTFSDGEYATLTYEEDQQMRAWMPHDSKHVNVEQVCGTGLAEQTYFVVEKDGVRYIEVTVPRYVSADLIVDNPEAVMNESYARLDSMVSWSNCLNDSLAGADEMVLATTLLDGDGNPDWTTDLQLTCGTSGLFPSPGVGAVGEIIRWFNPEDGTTINLEVTARTNDNSILVTPSEEFPSEYATENPRLYQTKSTITGLSHLEGEAVSVVVDGYVAASPFNDIENYETVTVVGGQITLPSEVGDDTGRGAIVHVGRPQIADIETLDIDSVEQRPVFIESQTVNKFYIKVHRSRGLYAGNVFPEDDLVKGENPQNQMVDIEKLDTNDNYIADGSEADAADLIGNRYIEPRTKRYEVTVPGDWKTQGRICLRAVDPLHFEILSIIPDTEDLRR